MTSTQMKRNNQSGNSIAVVLIVMTTLIALVAASIEYTQGLNRYANRSRSNVSAQAIGDACLELAFSQWRQICRNTVSTCTVPCEKTKPPATSAFAGIQLPTQAMFPDVPNFTATTANDQSFTVSNYKVQAVDKFITLTSTDPPVSSVATTTEAPGFGTAGHTNYWYLASCDVTLPSPSGPVTTKMRRIFEKKYCSAFQYFMFFNDDLELQPSSALTIYGAIHTNGKLYTGTSNLTANSTQPILTGWVGFFISTSYNPSGIAPTGGITYADDWLTGFKPGDTAHTGAATPPTVISSFPPARGQNLQVFDWDPNAWNATDADTTNDSPHELIELPPASGTDFMAKPLFSYAFNTNWAASVQRFSKDAMIRINVNANDVVTIFGKDSSGNELQLNSTMTGPSTDTTIVDYYGYQIAYNMWMTTLGGNLKTYPPGKVAQTGGIEGQLWLPKTVTDATVTKASATLTSASANFQPADVGRPVTGPNIPAGAFIKARTSATQVTMSAAAGALATASNVTVTFGGTLAAIQDNREGGMIDLVTTDGNVGKNWNPANRLRRRRCQADREACFNDLSGMGTYIHADPRTATGRKRAIRIKNGGQLTQINDETAYSPPWKITSYALIPSWTDNPLYIQGDFNSGRVDIANNANNPTNKTTVPACNNDATKLTWIYDNNGQCNSNPYWGGNQYTLYADALTVLSNNWSDANSTATLTSRPATNTTVNVNIVAGDVPTTLTNGYSGGGENFIRLMEDWNGKYFTFAGSMVQLYHSKTATGKWVPPGTIGNVYNEPIRNWVLAGWQLLGGGFIYTVAYAKRRWSPAP